jgi:nucleotide-binding universal stress UspA family protein
MQRESPDLEFDMKIKKILAPTDLSELSRAGLRYALELGKSEGAEVLVYNVVEPPQEWLDRHDEFYTVDRLIEKHKNILGRFLKLAVGDLLPQVSVRQEVGFGVSYKTIVEKAGEEKVDLIVMSTHGWSGLFHVLIGSVTERVVSRAPCPVLSIHPAEKSASAGVGAA